MNGRLKGLIVLLALMMIGACGRAQEENVEETKNPGVGLEEIGQEAVPGAKEDHESRTESGGEPVSGSAAQDGQDIFYYAFSALETQEERRLYQEVLTSLVRRERETELSTLSIDLIDPVFQCVMSDHPEIFYVDGYTSTTYKLGSELKKITFSGDFTLEEEEIARRTGLLEKAAAGWLEGIPRDADDYETVKYLYEYLIEHTEYEKGTADSQNICSVLLNGRSVCQGYAKTLQWLCQKAGIPALLATGQANGGGHAWTVVEVDGEWYHVDPTWGDASYQGGESGYPKSAYPAINYDYFCVTTKQIERTHELGKAGELPVCTAVENQYYRREGLYLEFADLEQIGRIFAEAAGSGKAVVSFQCADDGVFDQVYQLLIEQQRVFDYLPDADGKVAYTDSREQRTFSFWLSSEL